MARFEMFDIDAGRGLILRSFDISMSVCIGFYLQMYEGNSVLEPVVRVNISC